MNRKEVGVFDKIFPHGSFIRDMFFLMCANMITLILFGASIELGIHINKFPAVLLFVTIVYIIYFSLIRLTREKKREGE